MADMSYCHSLGKGHLSGFILINLKQFFELTILINNWKNEKNEKSLIGRIEKT